MGRVPSSLAAALALPYHWVYGAAALLAMLAGRRAPSPRVRRGWFALALAILTVPTAGLAAVWGPRLGPLANPIRDALAVLYYPVVALALSQFRPPRRLKSQRVRLGLDLALLVAAIGTISVYLWFRTSAADFDGDAVVYVALAPAGIFLAASAGGALLLRSPRLAAPPMVDLLLGGLALCITADILAGLREPFTATAPLWATGISIQGLAAWRAARHPAVPEVGSQSGAPPRPYTLLPYLAAVIVGVLLCYELFGLDDPAVRTLGYGAVLVFALVLLRQVAALRENADLMRDRAAQDARFRALVQHASDAFLVVEPDGTIRFHGPALPRVLGLLDRDHTGSSLLGIVAPDDRGRFGEYLRDIARAEEGASSLITVRIGAPDPRVVEMVASNWIHDSALGGIVLAARDITQRLRLQDQLQQARRMEGLGRLAGGVAHDFNNLLTAILGYADGLEDRIAAGTADAEDAREIKRAGQRAAELVRQLLAFARRQPGMPRVVSLNAVVEQMERMLRRLIGERVELTTAVDPALWSIRADPAQLEQVILNLALNARDALPDGGRLTLETRNVSLGREELYGQPELEPGEFVRLTMTDTGVGMSREVLAHVFEPFFTTKPVGLGTGLGLATVYGTVTQAGGAVAVRSEPGEGTQFTLLFPRAGEDPSEPGEPAPAIPLPLRGTILVAEDDPSVRLLTQRSLTAEGFRVLTAEDGLEALALAAAHSEAIELLITDVVMPRLGGRQLAARLQAERPTVRVLYMSGYAAEGLDPDHELAPGVEFLEKPFTARTLIDRVGRVLRGARMEG